MMQSKLVCTVLYCFGVDLQASVSTKRWFKEEEGGML